MKTRENDLEKLIKQISLSSPMKPDAKWNAYLGTSHFFSQTIQPIQYREGNNESSFLPLALTRQKDLSNPKSVTALNRLRELATINDKKSDAKSSLPPLDLTFFHTPFAYGVTGNISKLAACDLFDYMGYKIEPISQKQKTPLNEKIVYIKNLEGHIDYSVITPKGHVVYNIPTNIRYPTDHSYITLEQLKPVLLEVTSKAGHTYYTRYNGRFDVKEWIAQMILPIATLHQYGLVHRDIKLENYLAFREGEDTHIKLNDFDDIARNNDKNLTVRGSRRSYPKEMCDQNWIKFSDDNKPNNKSYAALDKNPIDSFALGTTICDILICCSYKLNDDTLLLPILDLIEQLTVDEPTKRLTMEQAMQHPLFGQTIQERNLYFESVKNKYKLKETFFDGFYLSPANRIPKENDVFLTLPSYLKKIVMTATDLNNQIIFIQKKFTSRRTPVECIDDYYIDEPTIKTIIKKSHTLKAQLDLIPFGYKIQLDNSKMIDDVFDLTQIKTHYKKGILYLSSINGDIAYTVITREGQLVRDIPTHIKAPVPFTEETLAPLAEPILHESGKNGHTTLIPPYPLLEKTTKELEDLTIHIINTARCLLEDLFIRKMESLSTDALINTVETAVIQHRRINQRKTKSPFFNEKSAFHFYHEKANIFLRNLKRMPTDTTPLEMLKNILEYLNIQKNNRINSFETILIRELQAISSEPFDRWFHQIPTVKNNLEHKTCGAKR